MMATVRRIMVVGSPGSGKTTLARRIADATGLSLRHLDDEYWGPSWTRPDPDWWTYRQQELVDGDSWIIDGNYLPTMAMRARRAELVVLVDTSLARCVARVLARALRIRRGRHDLLPLRVRAQALAGERVRATRDLLPLLALVLRFRTRGWSRVVEAAQLAGAGRLLVAVTPGLFGSRTGGIRRRLGQRAVPALVRPLAAAPAAADSWGEMA